MADPSADRATASVPHSPVVITTSPTGPVTDPVTDPVADVADVAAIADDLIKGLVAVPWGQVSPSVYETGRLVTFTPWLSGHARRVAYLLATQRPDGGWGAPNDGYALVPTLSATEALLSVLSRRAGNGDPDDEPSRPFIRTTDMTDAVLSISADAGLRFLTKLLRKLRPADGEGDTNGQREVALPDMPAIELIVPSLLTLIERRLADLANFSLPGMNAWRGKRLPRPTGVSEKKLSFVKELLTTGADVPQKLLHALEVAGERARGLPHIRVEPTGTIGASPAATAAWLGDRPPAEPSNPARWHLETVSAHHGGPVPVGYPLTVFERGWVLSWLIRAGVPVNAPPELILSLTAPLGPTGTSAAAGLPADADTTSGALYALALLGAPHRPDPLWAYEADTHFCTWQGEEGASTTTNAHVLEAFGQYLAEVDEERIGAREARCYRATISKVTDWLRTQQRPDGSWTDRWHASPYYATACCALALDRFGGEGAAAAVSRARRWVVETQRPEGSWGRWRSTPEETAYAVQTLLLREPEPSRKPGANRPVPQYTEPRPGQTHEGAVLDERLVQAASRARGFLERSLASSEQGDTTEPAWSRQQPDDPPLWHDKDLYHPKAIVRAAVLAAVHLLRVESHISWK